MPAHARSAFCNLPYPFRNTYPKGRSREVFGPIYLVAPLLALRAPMILHNNSRHFIVLVGFDLILLNSSSL